MPRLFEQARDREEGGLAVEGVEDRLHQQEIGAAVQETAGLLVVRLHEVVEGDEAGPGIVDVARKRSGPGGGSERARHPGEPPRRFGHHPVRGAPRELRARDVQLVGEVGQVVVGLRDGGRGEGVGLDDVRAGQKVLPVDLLDDVGAGQREQVAVALDVQRVGRETLAAEVLLAQLLELEHRAHGPVDDDDPLRQERAQGLFGGPETHPSSLAAEHPFRRGPGAWAAEASRNGEASGKGRRLVEGHGVVVREVGRGILRDPRTRPDLRDLRGGQGHGVGVVAPAREYRGSPHPPP